MDNNTALPTGLSSVADITYLTNDNAVFKKCGAFLSLELTIKSDAESDKNAEQPEQPEKKTYDRVFFHRAFPFDDPYEYISVMDRDNKEIGLIRHLSDFPDEVAVLLTDELSLKYYAPVVTSILSLKERYGFSYWNVMTDRGERNFTLSDTYRSIIRVSSRRIFIVDMSGNRYEIPDVEALDRISFKKIELYL